MPKLYDVKANQWIEVPDEQVEKYYQTGMYAFPKGAEVNIQTPDGRFGTVNEAFLQGALDLGASYDLATDRQERIDEREYGDKDLQAILLGGLRGASLSLSDIALEKSGFYTEEELRKIEEQNPVCLLYTSPSPRD